MQLKIKSFDTHKTALTVASVFALSSLLFLFPMFLMSFIAPSGQTPDGKPVNMATPMLVISLIMPIFYFIFGYVGVRFASWLYNKVSNKTGGIVVIVEQQEI